MHLTVRTLVTVVVSAIVSMSALSQDADPFVSTEDSRYFDFWVGTWHQEIDGTVDTNATRFIVRRTVHPAAYLEEWRMVIDPTETVTAIALRAWDKTNNRWMYTWVSDNALYQVWEGRKDRGNWYIYNRFTIAGEEYLSRQGWIPQGKNRLMRISEKSTDGGKTWELRFREYYRRSAE